MDYKERPILFSGEMVRAILDGRKTQTRRIITSKDFISWDGNFTDEFIKDPLNLWHENCPYGKPGEMLWVRETWGYLGVEGRGQCVVYKADGELFSNEDATFHGWKPSIHMFRKYSRLMLQIKNIRVERVQDITVDDCFKEGIKSDYLVAGTEIDIDGNLWPAGERAIIKRFQDLWDRINKKRGYGWDVNPWVWVIDFEVVW